MKRLVERIFILTLLVAVLTFGYGCGGGGSSGPDLCEAYCSFGCSKAADCGFLPPAGIGVCTDACVQEGRRQGLSPQLCTSAKVEVERMTCDEYATLLEDAAGSDFLSAVQLPEDNGRLLGQFISD